ncbi:mitochondrial inner membrane protease subunit 2-like [Clytia hemisphaerica]|uniref:mitochondrial inner membrane protease subunit 2-like n=1 Tax=Clytia hemisphaerica TaxID=252671 RepID=UPI0034D56A5F|eukprot:TCONS_00050765-protein
MSFFWSKVSQVSSSFLSGIVLGLPIYITVNDYFFSIARVEGASMKPALNPNGKKQSDFVFIDRWHTLPKDIQPGDIVALTSPTNHQVSFIKRVIGIEGEFLNTPRYRLNSVMIPKGHFWVEGDNYRSSLDSNKFGPISMGLVKGKATHVIWPPDRWSRLENEIPEKSPTERIDIRAHNRPKVIPKKIGVTIEIDQGDNEDSEIGNILSYDVEMALTEEPTINIDGAININEDEQEYIEAIEALEQYEKEEKEKRKEADVVKDNETANE